MTLFSYEVPLAHLEEFDPYQDFYFALSFLCKDPKYFDFMRKKKEAGKFMVLDNSFNELGQPDSPKEMAEIFYELQADKVVSPDSDGWSLEELSEAYEEMIFLVPKEKVLPVVRSVEEYMFFKKMVGTFAYCTTFYHRPKLPAFILYSCRHFLGLQAPWEIRRYTPFSCDTSMPIKLALRGETIADWMKKSCPHYHTKDIPNFFDLTLTKEQLTLALRNTKWIQINLGVNLAP